MSFKVGDRIVNLGCKCHDGHALGGSNNGKHGVVDGIDSSYPDGRCYQIQYDDGDTGWDWKCCYKLENKTIKMRMEDIIGKAKLAFTPEPEKTFIKAGVMNTSGELTEDGRTLFIEFLLEQHKADFKTKIVDPLLAEIKESNE